MYDAQTSNLSFPHHLMKRPTDCISGKARRTESKFSHFLLLQFSLIFSSISTLFFNFCNYTCPNQVLKIRPALLWSAHFFLDHHISPWSRVLHLDSALAAMRQSAPGRSHAARRQRPSPGASGTLTCKP